MKSAAELAADQAAFWNGPGGQAWLAGYERTQRNISGFGDSALAVAAAQPGEIVLDVGCGTGTTSAQLARAVAPGGRVLGVDISEPLVAAPRAQLVANATFEVADATTYPVESAAFDLVFSRFGVMFFADPVTAFRNLRRALKPDGRLVFVCWRTPQENPWGLVPMQAAAPFLPPVERPGPEEPGQYAFGDKLRVERILTQAGFSAPSFQTLDRTIPMGKDIAEVLTNIGKFGPLARRFADAAPAQIEKAKAAIAAALTPHLSADGIALAGACWLVSATAS